MAKLHVSQRALGQHRSTRRKAPQGASTNTGAAMAPFPLSAQLFAFGKKSCCPFISKSAMAL